MIAVAGATAASALERTASILNDRDAGYGGVPEHMTQLLADAIVTLTPTPWERHAACRLFIGLPACRPGATPGAANDRERVDAFFGRSFPAVAAHPRSLCMASVTKQTAKDALTAFFGSNMSAPAGSAVTSDARDKGSDDSCDTFVVYFSGRGKRGSGDWWLANMGSLSFLEVRKRLPSPSN